MEVFKLRLKCGSGTNTNAEFLALWCLLRFITFLGIDSIRLSGDSLTTVNWARKTVDLQAIDLIQWCNRINGILDGLHNWEIQHIYRELKTIADSLSKDVLQLKDDQLHSEEYIEDMLVHKGHQHFLFLALSYCD